MNGHLCGAHASLAICLGISSALAPSPATAALPGTMAATGAPRGPGGQPVANGDVELTLRLYDTKTGGNCSSTNDDFWHTACYQLSMLHSNDNLYALFNNVDTSVSFNELYFRSK